MKTSTEFKIGEGLAALLVLTLAAGFPFAIIWALNTLFPALAIPYNFWTWLATLVLGGFWKTKVKLDK
jgi:hypothetical protein